MINFKDPKPNGFRLIIISACRDLYNMNIHESRNLLEYEIYFQHRNMILDKDTYIPRDKLQFNCEKP